MPLTLITVKILFLKTQNLDLMNGANSTHFDTLIRKFFLFVVLLSGTFTAAMAQIPSCACKGAINVSVDLACEAAITADQLLANGATCGGNTSTLLVTLMKTPTGGIISSSNGVATLPDGQLYIGKTIYGKVTDASGLNSCWTSITIEDKIKPTWEDTDPVDVVVTCPAMSSYAPVAFDNCHTPKVYIVNETITVNDCINPIFAGPDTIKLIERTYLARDESGNVSDVACVVRIWVVGLDVDDIIGVRNITVECDANYAKLSNGNPSPTPVTVNGVTYFGTGVPSLYPWMPVLTRAGDAYVNPVNGNIMLAGGTLPPTTLLSPVGAQICVTANANGNIAFNWTASKAGPGAPDNVYLLDHARYTVNNVATNLTQGIGGLNTQSGVASVPVLLNDVFCFQVRTDNLGSWTVLNLSNISGPIPANIALNPGGSDCNIYVTYSDTKLPQIKCVTKIIRRWQILEWSCDSKILEFIQIIEINDSKGPLVTGLKDDYATTNGHTCEGLYKLQKPTLTDNCSDQLTYDVTTYDENGNPTGFLKGLKVTDADKYVKLPLGCVEILYTAYDECHNQTEHTISVFVEDNTPPVAICDQNTTVGLTLDGTAWVPATSFDDGSYDECDLAKMLVRRMDGSAACKPCKTPSFPGFTHLGEYTNVNKNVPHYYYISKHRANVRVAMRTAEAMGGYVVAINSAAEGTWLHGKVLDWKLNEDYLIGLRDPKAKGEYSWSSGETSTYRNWDVGHPRNKNLTDGLDSLWVIAKDVTGGSAGKWQTIAFDNCDSDEYLYVVEITDPCGFSEYAQFCCADVSTSPKQVVFRVIDKSGNWNECMVNAIVQDKLPPRITCPPHMTVTCNDYFDTAKLYHTFGWATAYDNCDNIRITTDSIIDLNSCRIGKITRTFTATDPGGRTATCTQIIHVHGPEFPFVMAENRWPLDVTIQGCEDPNDDAFSPDNLGKPNLAADNICSLVGAEYDDQIFTFNNSFGEACFKILRHWTVIDWCQRYDLPGGGYEYRTWTHTQIIKVYDPVKPVITSSCAPKSTCTFDPTCTDGYIELTASATDVCTQVLRYTYKIDAFNDGSFESGLSKSGLGNTADASNRYPIGTHKIVWAFEDRCGNVTKCEQLFTIANCKAPTPYCINGLATSLMPMDTDNDGTPDTGMVEIWAKDFDNGSSHPCGYRVYLSFAPITLGQNGVPVVVASRTFTCNNLGRNDVNLYAGVLTPMGTIVQDFCSTFINIQDNFDVCDDVDGRFVVNGAVMTETDAPVKEVNVSLEGSEMNLITNNTGTYNFEGMLSGSNYVVRPTKNDDHINGISTLDLVMIQRHILGIEKLNSPYKLIAADVNKDKKITASDLTELRKLILGIVNEFSNNTSWRFIDKAYTFQDAQYAQAESFPEVYYIENMNSNMEANFMSIKVGDVNGNVVANVNDHNTESRSSSIMELTAENQTLTAGQTINVPVVLAQNADVSGFQFTVNYDTELFSLEAVNGGITGMTDNNFGFTRLANGMVTVSYNRENSLGLKAGDIVFTLSLKAKDQGKLSEGFWIDSAVTKAEAYTAEHDVIKVEFNVNNRVEQAAVLYQNTPNPFKAITSIGFDLPEVMDATVTIFDVTGKTLKVIKQSFNKGYNTIELNKNELGSVGVLYYKLEAGDFTATRKMVVIE